MRYFQSAGHFLNYIKKAFRDSAADFPGTLTVPILKFYEWSEKYNGGDAVNAFTWEYKGVLHEITRGHFDSFKDEYSRRAPFELEIDAYSSTFIESVICGNRMVGCYILYDTSGKVAYVGKSINLPDRVFSSIKERSKHAELEYVRIIYANSSADISIIESWLIATEKPYLNKDQYSLENLTVGVSGIPEMSEPITIYR